MKKIYKIGTKQDFTYTILSLFKKKVKTEEHWVVRNVKYIYASDIEEARDKYERWFFKEYEAITRGWGNWYCQTDGVSAVMMDEKHIDITSTKIVYIDENKDIDVNLETLKEHMQAENFKEWWFDNHDIEE